VFTRKALTKLSLSHPKSPLLQPFKKPQSLQTIIPPTQMATSSSSSTGTTLALIPASQHRRTFSSLVPVYSSVSIKVLTAFLEGMGLVILPSLPIVCTPFNFLKSLDLTTVGLG